MTKNDRSTAPSKPAPEAAPRASIPFTMEEATGPVVPVGTGVAQAEPAPKPMAAYEADAGGGFEDTTGRDYAIPLIVVLQKGSPQLDSANAGAFMPEAKQGMLMNSVTRELFDGKEGIVVIPVHRKHSFVEWIPRAQGGGLVDIYDPSHKLVLEATKGWKGFGKVTLPNEHELVETMSMFLLLVRGDRTDPVVINFASTQLKAYKAWMTRAKSITFTGGGGTQLPYPLWAHYYRLTTEPQKNAKGSWFGWVATFNGASAEAARIGQDHPLYQAAKGFRDLATSGTVKVAMETDQRPTDDLPADPDKL